MKQSGVVLLVGSGIANWADAAKSDRISFTEGTLISKHKWRESSPTHKSPNRRTRSNVVT